MACADCEHATALTDRTSLAVHASGPPNISTVSSDWRGCADQATAGMFGGNFARTQRADLETRRKAHAQLQRLACI
eukprot:4644821-Pleurochrysis_carterae.AAC.1